MLPEPWGRATHSQAEVALVPVEGIWAEEIAREARRWFGADVTEVRRVGERGGSLNFRLTCASGPTLLFKVQLRIDDPAVVAVLERVQRWLYDAGVLARSPDRDALLALPAAQLLPRGCPIVSGRGGHAAFLTAHRWVEGRHFDGATDDELAEVACELGRVARALAGLPADLDLSRLGRARAFDLAPAHASLAGRIPLLVEAEGLVTRALAASALPAAPAVAPTAAAWGDAHPHNVLVRDGRCVLLYDFEDCAREPSQEPSLAFAVHRFTREWKIAAADRTVERGVELFLDAYRRGGGTVDSGFRARLPVYIRRACLRKIFYMGGLLAEGPTALTAARLAELHRFVMYLGEAEAY